MKKYIGTKIVNATPMSRVDYNEYRGWVLPANEEGSDEGYLVEYTDGGKANDARHVGYISWSPKAQFDAAYSETTGLPFAAALEALKLGKRVEREGWNGRGLHVRLIFAGNAMSHGDAMKDCFGLSNGNGSIQPGWVPSVGDIFADDWRIV